MLETQRLRSREQLLHVAHQNDINVNAFGYLIPATNTSVQLAGQHELALLRWAHDGVCSIGRLRQH